MRTFRLQREKYGTKLSGKGAAIAGARWNSKGTEIVYTSASRALAMAEVAVHLDFTKVPSDFTILEIDIPDSASQMTFPQFKLPENWFNIPPTKATKTIGDEFCRVNEFLILKVPSAVVFGDFNLLLNPHHPEFELCKVIGSQKFPFDRRFFRS